MKQIDILLFVKRTSFNLNRDQIHELVSRRIVEFMLDLLLLELYIKLLFELYRLISCASRLGLVFLSYINIDGCVLKDINTVLLLSKNCIIL